VSQRVSIYTRRMCYDSSVRFPGNPGTTATQAHLKASDAYTHESPDAKQCRGFRVRGIVRQYLRMEDVRMDEQQESG